jgi:uncharacterized tellurite resistance protein B-like protein
MEEVMTPVINVSRLPREQKLAFIYSLFALANIDGEVQPEELEIIAGSMGDRLSLSDNDRLRVTLAAHNPLPLEECLEPLKAADVNLRVFVFLYLVDVALADGILHKSEAMALTEARRLLDISHATALKIQEVADRLKRLRSLAYKQASEAGDLLSDCIDLLRETGIEAREQQALSILQESGLADPNNEKSVSSLNQALASLRDKKSQSKKERSMDDPSEHAIL